MALVAFVVFAARGLDLNAQEVGTLAGFGLGDDGYVVGRGVSPGTGDGESLLGGAGHEEELGPFALLFVVSESRGFGHEWALGSWCPRLPKAVRHGAPDISFVKRERVGQECPTHTGDFCA